MEQTYVVSGGRKGIKKSSKAFFLPEIFVENEEGVRHRSGSGVRHSTPNQGGRDQLKEVLDTSVDSGLGDWSINEPSYTSDCTHERAYKTPSAKPVEASMWDSFVSPIQDLRQHFKSRPSFVEDRVKIKFNVETLVTACLVMVMFSSIVFSVYMGTNLLSTNGKFKSIKYGASKKIQNMRKEGRLIEYDIKDENGVVLGGKRAAIQFAYNQKYGAQQNSKDVKSPPTKDVPSEPKVVKTKVEDPVPTKKVAEEQDLSIAELSRKIDELNALLQNDLEVAVSQLDLDEKLATMKEKKRNMIKKIKPRNSVKPDKPAGNKSAPPAAKAVKEAADASAASTGEAADVEAADANVEGGEAQQKPKKAGKTKVENPLTKSVPKKSKPKKSKVSQKPEVDEKIEDHPGGEDVDDLEEQDPGLLDYPDDPQFRGKDEV